MQQLMPFLQHHWVLGALLLILILTAILNECLHLVRGPKRVSPVRIVAEINHQHTKLVDLRPKEAFKAGHILDSISIPAADVSALKIYQTSPLILVCERGLQSSALASRLKKHGFSEVSIMDGGINAWTAANLPLVKPKK